MSTKDDLRNLANDCTGLFSTFVPKQILREAADELDTKQSRIDQLEKELAEARKDAEPPELLTNIHALSEWACDVIDETVSELLKHNPTSDAANKLYMVAGRLSALSSDVSHWQESRDAAIDAAMEAK